MEDESNTELKDAIAHWLRVCEEKRDLLRAHAGPPGQPHEHTGTEARERFRFLSQREEETRKRMDEAFLAAIAREWGD